MKRNTFYKSEVCWWPSIIPPLYLLRRSLFSLSTWRNIGSKIFLYKNVPQLTPLSIWEICFTINALFTLPLWDTNGMRAWITSPPMSWVETLIKLKWIEEKKQLWHLLSGGRSDVSKQSVSEWSLHQILTGGQSYLWEQTIPIPPAVSDTFTLYPCRKIRLRI